MELEVVKCSSCIELQFNPIVMFMITLAVLPELGASLWAASYEVWYFECCTKFSKVLCKWGCYECVPIEFGWRCCCCEAKVT